jgi:hypothetical protein
MSQHDEAVFNEKKAENKKLEDDIFFGKIAASLICEKQDEIAQAIYAEKQREQELELKLERLAAQQQHQPGELVLQIADRQSSLDHAKADILLISGVGHDVLMQLFDIFKKGQDELARDGIVLEKNGKHDSLITFSSAHTAHQFLQFLLQIQNRQLPNIGNNHLCAPYLGLLLIAELDRAIENEPSLLAHRTPFNMHFKHR